MQSDGPNGAIKCDRVARIWFPYLQFSTLQFLKRPKFSLASKQPQTLDFDFTSILNWSEEENKEQKPAAAEILKQANRKPLNF